MIRYRNSVLLLVTALLFIGCSSRQVYQSASIALPLADAININTASTDELEKLPHIGRKTAETILKFREENGPFRRVEHLLQIRGISEKRFAEIRQFLRTE